MSEDEAVRYLKSKNEEACDSIAELIKSMRDELESVWQMLEDLKQSEILNHQQELSQRVNEILKEKSRIAKVSEA